MVKVSSLHLLFHKCLLLKIIIVAKAAYFVVACPELSQCNILLLLCVVISSTKVGSYYMHVSFFLFN